MCRSVSETLNSPPEVNKCIKYEQSVRYRPNKKTLWSRHIPLRPSPRNFHNAVRTVHAKPQQTQLIQRNTLQSWFKSTCKTRFFFENISASLPREIARKRVVTIWRSWVTETNVEDWETKSFHVFHVLYTPMLSTKIFHRKTMILSINQKKILDLLWSRYSCFLNVGDVTSIV